MNGRRCPSSAHLSSSSSELRCRSSRLPLTEHRPAERGTRRFLSCLSNSWSRAKYDELNCSDIRGAVGPERSSKSPAWHQVRGATTSLLVPYMVYRETTSVLVALHRLPRPKRKDLSHRLRANKLLLPQLAAASGKRFSQIGFQTIRVAERGIEDRLHLLSTLLRVTGRGCMNHSRFSLRSCPVINSAMEI